MKALSPQRLRDVEALVRRHQDGVRSYLYVLGCPSDRLDDIAQDVFLSVLSGGFVERSDTATRGFLRKVARHLFLKTMERERRVEVLEDVDRATEIWNATWGTGPARELIELLRRCREGVRGRAAEVLSLRYERNEALACIAGRMGLTESGVKSILVRTRRQLRECIERRRGR